MARLNVDKLGHHRVGETQGSPHTDGPNLKSTRHILSKVLNLIVNSKYQTHSWGPAYWVLLVCLFQTLSHKAWPQSESVMASPNSETGSLVAPVGSGRTGPKKLSIQFDNELVKGENAVPEIETVFTQQQFNFKKMIKLREHFIPEVIKGKEEFGASE